MTEQNDHRVTDESSGLEYSSQRITVDGRGFVIIEATPTRPIVVSRDRIDRLRAGDSNSSVDRSMLEICANWTPSADAVVFVADAGPDRSWSMADDLDHAERIELGAAMVEGQLALYRGLVQAGIFSLTGIALRDADLEAFSRGTDGVAARIERALPEASVEDAPTLRLDLWLLDHIPLWTTASRERFFAGRLPETLSLISRRRGQLQTMRTDILESGAHSLPHGE